MLGDGERMGGSHIRMDPAASGVCVPVLAGPLYDRVGPLEVEISASFVGRALERRPPYNP